MQKLKQTRRKHKKSGKKQKRFDKKRRNKNTFKKYWISSPRTSATNIVYAVGFWAGYPVFQFVYVVCSRRFSVDFIVVCFKVFFMFSPSLFKLMHLQSKKTHLKTETHINNFDKKKHVLCLKRKQEKQQKRQHYFPAGTLEIFIRGRVLDWISCMYVVVCCSRSFSVDFMCVNVFAQSI